MNPLPNARGGLASADPPGGAGGGGRYFTPQIFL